MGIFGENSSERELRQEIASLYQETGSLRQQLATAQEASTSLREENSQLHQHIQTLQAERESLQLRLRNAVNTAKRKYHKAQRQEHISGANCANDGLAHS